MKIILGITISASIVLATNKPHGRITVSEDLGQIEKISGSHFCALDGPTRIEGLGKLNEVKPNWAISPELGGDAPNSRKIVLDSFPNNYHPCIDMGVWNHNLLVPNEADYQKNSGFITIDGSKIPVIVTRRSNSVISSEDFSGTIIVRISGGPGGIEFQPINEFAIFLEEGDFIFDFFYSGSGFNLIYPSPNFEVASNQVKYFIERLRKLNPSAQIVLFGESLGGPIVLSALQASDESIEQVSVDKIILSNPLAISPAAFLEKEKAENAASPDKQSQRIYRTIETKNDDWSTRNIEALDPLEVYEKFFEPHNFEIGIERRLAKVRNQDILLIYGSEDPVIGVDVLEDFQAPENVKMVRIDGMGHSPSTAPHIFEMRDAIDDFLLD